RAAGSGSGGTAGAACAGARAARCNRFRRCDGPCRPRGRWVPCRARPAACEAVSQSCLVKQSRATTARPRGVTRTPRKCAPLPARLGGAGFFMTQPLPRGPLGGEPRLRVDFFVSGRAGRAARPLPAPGGRRARRGEPLPQVLVLDRLAIGGTPAVRLPAL